jgi:hypothetical protein
MNHPNTRDSHPTRPHPLALILLAAALLFSSACQMARMALPPNLAAEAREMVCVGRQGFKFNEAFDFAPFKVLDVHRTWTTIQGWDGFWFSSARASQRYEFTTQEPGGPYWDARCAVGAAVTDVEIRNFLGGDLKMALDGGQTLLGLLRERGYKAWTLALGQSVSERSLSGILEKGNVRIEIRAQHQLARTSLGSFEAAGFILTLEGEPVAAVETMNRGAVWIHPGVKPEIRSVLAAAAAALLLYQDLLALDLSS